MRSNGYAAQPFPVRGTLFYSLPALVASTGGQVIRWPDSGQAPEQALPSAERATLVRAALSRLSVDDQTWSTTRSLDGVPVGQLAARE
ncbi:MAG: hypothetical protein ACUVUC_16085 [Thermoguttaceae bacterium]